MTDTPIGVLALQGDFELHLNILKMLGCPALEVRLPEHLDEVQGLIIPGGESTAVGKLLVSSGLDLEIPGRYCEGSLAIFGTCMGTIMIAKSIENSSQYTMGLLDVTVRRNSYGRQVDSFETDIPVTGIGTNGSPVRAVFIRAPQILSTGPGVETLATFAGLPVLVRQGRMLGCCFHPEAANETRIHSHFIEMSSTKTAAAG